MKKLPSNYIEMTGKKFGRLTIVSRDGTSKDGKAMWKCLCECGNYHTGNGKLIRNGTIRSCGCLIHERSSKFIDLSGRRFGRLLVLKYHDNNTPQKRVSRFLCVCDCGVQRILPGVQLTCGQTRSCGCLNVDRIRERSTTHGATIKSGRTKEYRAWKSMKDRCYLKSSKSYHCYGGRGISVCERWRYSFKNFLSDIGLAPSAIHQVERRGNNGMYEPDNVYWAVPKIQARNRRTNVLATHEGVTLCALDWAIKIGVPSYTVLRRLHAKWTIHQIIQHYVPNSR